MYKSCTFKLFHRRVFKGIELESSGAMINTEMLVKIKDKGFNFEKVGVLPPPRLAGKQTGANLRVVLRIFKELFRFYGKMREKNL
jgi:hypothetical protein